MAVVQRHNDPLDTLSALLSFDLSDDTQRSRALALLENTFQASCGGFYLMDSDGRPCSYVLDGLEPILLQLYQRTYRKQDPLDPERYYFSPMPRVVRLVDAVASMEEFERTAYYREFLRLCNMYHEMDAYLAWGGRLLGGFFLARPKTRPPFSDQELKLLVRLVEPLALHLFRCRLIRWLATVTDGFRSAVRAVLPPGSFLLDSDLFCLFADPQAASKLGIQEGDRWRHPLAEVFREGLGGPGVAQTTFHLPSGARVSMMAVPGCPEGAPVILGQVGRDSCGLHSAWHAFAQHFGLSERELQVVVKVAAGLSNRKIAADLGIAELTVKTHLKNIFRKLGISCRTQLAAAAWRWFDSGSTSLARGLNRPK